MYLCTKYILNLLQPAGDLGSFTADKTGRATFQIVSDNVKVLQHSAATYMLRNQKFIFTFMQYASIRKICNFMINWDVIKTRVIASADIQ